MPKTKKRVTKKIVRTVGVGRVYVQATFNNSIITITDDTGNVIAWASSGSSGFKGTRKSTPFAATTAVENAIAKAQGVGLQSIEVYIKGPGPGRDAAIRALKNAGMEITMIADVTPIPHNGPRPSKRRRN